MFMVILKQRDANGNDQMLNHEHKDMQTYKKGGWVVLRGVRVGHEQILT